MVICFLSGLLSKMASLQRALFLDNGMAQAAELVDIQWARLQPHYCCIWKNGWIWESAEDDEKNGGVRFQTECCILYISNWSLWQKKTLFWGRGYPWQNDERRTETYPSNISNNDRSFCKGRKKYTQFWSLIRFDVWESLLSFFIVFMGSFLN